MPDVTIRRVRTDDGPLLRRVRLRALATDPASFGSTLAREETFGDEVWNERATAAAAGGDWATLLALRGEEPVGLVTGARDETDPRTFHVFSMWVAPEARGEGLGRRLLDRLEEWMRASGGTVARLSVTDQAESARRLYERAGYEPDGETTASTHTPGLIEISFRKTLGR